MPFKTKPVRQTKNWELSQTTSQQDYYSELKCFSSCRCFRCKSQSEPGQSLKADAHETRWRSRYWIRTRCCRGKHSCFSPVCSERTVLWSVTHRGRCTLCSEEQEVQQRSGLPGLQNWAAVFCVKSSHFGLFRDKNPKQSELLFQRKR